MNTAGKHKKTKLIVEIFAKGRMTNIGFSYRYFFLIVESLVIVVSRTAFQVSTTFKFGKNQNVVSFLEKISIFLDFILLHFDLQVF